ncbi:hypothetical protein EV421DRAFT_2014668 [Armillaria borealis]|uniref:Uncharacterized protein n=1 Tax=Armillaria borealis TaxID=47425 RepID=A0AA39N0R9_9AGAR|nr:hypothetical protein EV421DRAFT_2014668 [Armillaria borealis]
MLSAGVIYLASLSAFTGGEMETGATIATSALPDDVYHGGLACGYNNCRGERYQSFFRRFIKERNQMMMPVMYRAGIIDWESAGWYPYFWDDFIARRCLHWRQFSDGKWKEMLPVIMPAFLGEVA